MMGGPVIFRVTFLFAVLMVFHGSAGSIAFFRTDPTSKSSQVPPFVQMILLPITVGSTSNSIIVEFQLPRIVAPSVLATQGLADKGYDGSPPGTKSYIPSTKEIIPSLGENGESQTKSGPSVQKDHGFTPSNLIPPISHSRRMSEARVNGKVPNSNAPIRIPLTPAPFSSMQRELLLKPPAMHPIVSPILLSSSVIHGKQFGMPVAAPLKEVFNHLSPTKHSPHKGSFPDISPSPHEATKPPANESAPIVSFPKLPTRKRVHGPAAAPLVSSHKHHARKVVSNPASAPSHLFSPPSYHRGPVIPPSPSHSPVVPPKRNKPRKHTPPSNQVLSPSPLFSTVNQGPAPAPSPSLTAPSSLIKSPIYSPTISPSTSLPRKPRIPVPPPVQALPPPPPNQDCTSLTCTEPLTNTLPGSPCACVWPMKVGLRLSVALYTFFPLVSELAKEIASGIFMKQSQVRIMGANAASLQPEKTVVLIDLVPLGEKFDHTTAFFTYERFWHKQVVIKSNLFGDYEVLYVRFPGLPPSPPLAPSNITIEDEPYPNDNNGIAIKPIGVDVTKRKHKLDRSLIAILALSSAIALVVCVGVLWLLLLRRRDHARRLEPASRSLVPPPTKPSAIAGAGSMNFGSGPSSASVSLNSSIATYTGSAKTFSLSEIEKATGNFEFSRILGEGGFGLVYSGILDDGTKVAVKVLKRDDHQGGREFLAEVEMLSRLHHRNLVKLIGICTEEHCRCLVYELIPNGSVESHLHGVDKETAPLDWDARMKIALGSARGLAYLHEDSSPRVIHRDFKSSNILLEHDFTPKVSDFGLARTALDEQSEHISTRVMGTFGYVAPEYAMTGHLLVKSDVYSYGVVLLELLTGRKPVDMLQPSGQENLVNWARPLLTSKEGLEMIIDPALGSNIPFDSVAKVAAIASMCVQPEVSHRPFMGEVVQALKLVCNEFDEKKGGSGSFSQENMETRMGGTFSGQLPETRSYVPADYESGLEADRALSASDIFSTSARYARQESGSFRRHSSSGPLISGRNLNFWQRVRGLSRGSVSEHGFALKSWVGLEGGEHWP